MFSAIFHEAGKQQLLWVILGLLAAVPVFSIWAGEPFWNDIAMRIMILGLAAIALNFILGYGGMVSFGHASFVGLGAYAVAISQYHGIDSGWLHILISLCVTGMLGLVIGMLSLRTSGLYFIMITLAFGQMLYFFFISLEFYGGDDGVVLNRSSFAPFDIGEPLPFYFLIWGGLALCSVLLLVLVHSRFGVILRASKSNADRIEAMGLEPFRYRVVAYVISAMMCGIAGVFLANWQEYASPDIMHWSRSGELMVIIVLGGLGTLAGPLVGAVGFLLLEEFLPEIIGTIAPSYAENWMIVFGPLLVLMVLFARGGILGLGGRIFGSERR